MALVAGVPPMMPTLAWLPLALPTDAIAVVAVFLTAAVVPAAASTTVTQCSYLPAAFIW